MRGPLRCLVISHSHPRVLHGGSEVASYSLFERLRAEPDVEAAYLGCSRGAMHARSGPSITQPFPDGSFLYSLGEFDWFRFANRDMRFVRDFRALLAELRPDVVHFHHYINVGVEAFHHVREVLPDASIVLTLHEMLAICNQQGQMVTRPDGKLCTRSGNVECARCFPEVSPADFFLRRAYLGRFLALVDRFVAPSAFLARRFVEWGLPEERVEVLENVPAAFPAPGKAATLLGIAGSDVPAARPGGNGLRVGFFGQISELKGMDVLLDAAKLLDREGRTDISFRIHGDHTTQPQPFQERFRRRIAKAGSNLVFEGAYRNEHVDALMRDVDVVVVPSVWWENSPVVIQESFRNGRPVLCSNIGGMAEKVVDGVTGRHFGVNNPRALATLLTDLADDPAGLDALRRGVAARERPDSFAAHLALYRGLRAGPGTGPDVTTGGAALAGTA
ncbi:glycosyltransferase family 4 protein [Rhizosaccharibacter radicis]|uniref:Glycosyltransferase family 4 protein n=1 Tax=Rhizosaccharibacter radicis TaxID=2782605 RepID=A0ABT1VT55_9PROT|nr:glycosyltransferase family 4 protein [Acetobacteraceae bacterium KSS12]